MLRLALGFAPFIVFALLSHVLAMPWCMTIVAAVAVVRMFVGVTNRTVKPLDAGQATLFVALAAATWVWRAAWSLLVDRAVVISGLLVIVLASLAVSRPFALVHARDRVPRERWNDPLVRAVSTTITWVWAGAFAVSLAVLSLYWLLPGLPSSVVMALAQVSQWCAMGFSLWYPGKVRRLAQARG